MMQIPQKHDPFDCDIKQRGVYQYTDGSRFSAVIANKRYTQMILSSTDFIGKSVVDVGSGDGTYTAELAELSGAASVLGVEPSAKAVQRASTVYKEKFPHLDFVCGVSEMLLQQGQKFDVAVYRGVIHHVADPIEEIRCALIFAQTVVILEPNGQNPFMKLVEKVSPYHRQHQEQSYSLNTVSCWIISHGGIVKTARFFGLVPYFCPRMIARLGKWLEPFVEGLPFIPKFFCGQYIITALRGKNS